MCGRLIQCADAGTLNRHFRLARAAAEPEPRYNIAPGQDIAIVRHVEGIGRVLDRVHWGLVPGWARDPAIGRRLFNARGERAAEKPAFRAAFARRRCLVPADGFYEWQRTGRGKQPYWIGRPDREPFAVAGLWEHWDRPDGHGVLESCVLLTVRARDDLAAIHERMPVILAPGRYAEWLDPATDRARLEALVRDNRQVALAHHPVAVDVNSPLKDNPGLMRPLRGAAGV